MIEIKDGGLLFSFPEISERLRRLVDAEIDRRLPEWLTENRGEVLRRLCDGGWRRPSSKPDGMAEEEYRSELLHRLSRGDWRYDGADSAWIAEAESRLAGLTADDFRMAALQEVSKTLPKVEMEVSLMRTFRIPDDGRAYPLPPGLGRFPLRHIDDFAASLPGGWLKRGGVMMPMYQSEALWIQFGATYPFALKVATGKIDAISGSRWCPGLKGDRQNYVVVPGQPWLDGYCVGKGLIRQFVAMPLGDGYGAEEQITGRGEFGGIQLQAHPMRADLYFKDQLTDTVPKSVSELLPRLVGFPPRRLASGGPVLCAPVCSMAPEWCLESSSMSLSPGGQMRQEIYKDEKGPPAWDTEVSGRCFVHLCNSLAWRQITGENPPQPPFTAAEYTAHDLPWFDWYDDSKTALKGGTSLKGLKSVAKMGKEKGANPLPENKSADPKQIVRYGARRRPEQVREWVR